jgi:hypothetical protein
MEGFMSRSIGIYVLNISVALYLFATGIMGFGKKASFAISNSDPEIRRAVTALNISGDFAEVLIVILSVLAIAAGLFILLKLFNIKIPQLDLLLVILAIVWIVFIIMIDVVGPINARKKPDFIPWLLSFSSHFMVLGGILLSTEKFGG